MEKLFRWLYYSFLSVFMTLVLYMCLMLFFAPRNDALRRGFIPCTEQLVMQLSDCRRGNIACSLKYLWHDTRCNIDVVIKGLSDWFDGKQSTPWENYLFKPVLQDYKNELVETDVDFSDNTKLLKKQYRQLLQKDFLTEQKALQNLNLSDKVLVSNPADQTMEDSLRKSTIVDDTVDDYENSGDIKEEVFEEEISDIGDNQKKTKQKTGEDIIMNLRRITEEKLKMEGENNGK